MPRILIDRREVEVPHVVTGAELLAHGLLDCTYELTEDHGPRRPEGWLGPVISPFMQLFVQDGDSFVATPRCTGVGG